MLIFLGHDSLGGLPGYFCRLFPSRVFPLASLCFPVCWKSVGRRWRLLCRSTTAVLLFLRPGRFLSPGIGRSELFSIKIAHFP
jgi:hypothetical protein